MTQDRFEFQVSDEISIFSEKAYRREGGNLFEAIGNVVIVNASDTLYGEKAIYRVEKGEFFIEGNVRFVGKGMTLYASSLLYFLESGRMEVENARLITPDYTLVSEYMEKKSETVYEAKEAEFSTCDDCPESWSVYGEDIRLERNEYVRIKNGIFRISGVTAMYFPYIVFPVKKDRETGLLMPIPSSRGAEGFGLQQPFFWAIDPYSDATITPSIWGERGPGTDLEYRQNLQQSSYLHARGRLLRDSLYSPASPNFDPSGETYYRGLGEVEGHWEQGLGFDAHFRTVQSKDLEFVNNFALYADRKIHSSTLGTEALISQRFDQFSLTMEMAHRQDQLVADPEEYAEDYVQVLPRATIDSAPLFFLQGKRSWLSKGYLQLQGDGTRFTRSDNEGSSFLRNAYRLDALPTAHITLLDIEGFALSSHSAFDYQYYSFEQQGQPIYYKYSTPMQTEFSFGVEKIFGLAYQRSIPVDRLQEVEREKIYQSDEGAENTQTTPTTIGTLPSYSNFLSKEQVNEQVKSYRHYQEVRFIHHYIPMEEGYGNEDFSQQIQERSGWFDFRDSVRSQEFLLGNNSARTLMPPENTLEFAWEHSLTSKTPLSFNPQQDERYLQQNFQYQQLGFFRISQGLLLDARPQEPQWTRLRAELGMTFAKWSFDINENYFHETNDHVLGLNVRQTFNRFALNTGFSYSSFEQDNNQTLTLGIGIRPFDTIGLGVNQSRDLVSDTVTRSELVMGYRPSNTCWLVDFVIVDNFNQPDIFTFNFMLNFGDDRFDRVRSTVLPGG